MICAIHVPACSLRVDNIIHYPMKGIGKIFLNSHPRLKTPIFLLPIVFIAGFGVGVYITLLVQNQPTTLGISAIIVPVSSGLSIVVIIFSALRGWQKNKNAPTLEFNGVISREPYGHNTDYFLRVNMFRPHGEAKDCHGYISIEHHSHQTITSGWSSNNRQYVNIGNIDELRLFRVTEEANKQIIFFNMPLAKGQPLSSVPIPYYDVINKRLTVKIVAEDPTKIPLPFTRMISEIIEEGNKNKN